MFIFQVHHFIQSEQIETYKQATLENARRTVQEPGVLRFDMFQDKEDPGHFSLLEVYVDQAAQARHLESAHFLTWKDVYLATQAKRGYGHEFEMLFPDGMA